MWLQSRKKIFFYSPLGLVKKMLVILGVFTSEVWFFWFGPKLAWMHSIGISNHWSAKKYACRFYHRAEEGINYMWIRSISEPIYDVNDFNMSATISSNFPNNAQLNKLIIHSFFRTHPLTPSWFFCKSSVCAAWLWPLTLVLWPKEVAKDFEQIWMFSNSWLFSLKLLLTLVAAHLLYHARVSVSSV